MMMFLVWTIFSPTSVAAVPEGMTSLIGRCAPDVDSSVLQTIVQKTSGFQAYAISAHGQLTTPQNFVKAMTAIGELESAGDDYRLGIALIGKANLARLGLTPQKALDVCANLKAAGELVKECSQASSDTSGILACYEQANASTSATVTNTDEQPVKEASQTVSVQREEKPSEAPLLVVHDVKTSPLIF